MNGTFFAAVMLSLTATASAEAAVVKADFTAATVLFHDSLLTFGGESLSFGDQFQISFIYDADRLMERWSYENEKHAHAYGGTSYDTGGDNDPVISPIISATIKIGKSTHTMTGDYYGGVTLSGENYGSRNYNHVYFAAHASETHGLTLSRSWYTSRPSIFVNPTFDGPYSFNVPVRRPTSHTGVFRLYGPENEDGYFVGLSRIDFNIIHGEIGLYDGEPPQPAPIPLPASALLILTGLGGLFCLRRTRRVA